VRIIAGEFRGRRLQTPKGRNIRPTSDRVREAIFSAIRTRIAGANVLDLFAGTGALGLEALSRGAARATFIDNHIEAIRLIEENIGLCGVQERTVVMRRAILPSLGVLAAQPANAPGFHLVFLDPPYGQNKVPAVLERLTALSLVPAKAVAVAEHHHNDAIPSRCGSWHKTKERRYGDTLISYFSCESPDAFPT
jgi:16S rRNA (guanine966-N2)-methyltransferase